MAIRLNKVLSELNIGLQTAVDFLKNKKGLGEIADDASLSTKISDEQYQALVSEFRGDKDVKAQAGMIFPKKEKKEKKETKAEPVKIKEEPRQQFTPLGKIDLSSLGAKPKQQTTAESPAKQDPKPQPVTVAPMEKEEPKEPEKTIVPEPTPAVESTKSEEKPQAPQAEPEPEAPVQEATQQVQAPAPQEPEPESEPEPKATEEKVFKLKTEQKLAPKVNVLGKIDLDSLNQSTRPKKKSKEEKKKEREEKLAQQRSEKKKRVRIGK